MFVVVLGKPCKENQLFGVVANSPTKEALRTFAPTA